MKKSIYLIVLLLFFGLISHDVVFSKSEASSVAKVYARNALEKQARRLLKSGHLDEAIDKYREATQPEYIYAEYEKASAIGSISNVYRLKGDYDSALKELAWFVRESLSKKPVPSLIERQKQLIALREYQRTKNPQPLLDFLANYKEVHKQDLPPNGHDSTYVTTVLRLYDTLGDYDSGIAFIDEFFAYRLTGKAGDPKRGWVDAEFLKVREAFEQDKAEGKKGSMAEGKPGRATWSLIQYTYFPE